MKNLLLFVLVALLPCRAMADGTADSLLKVLRSEIARKGSYDSVKEKYIAQLKQKLSKSTNLNDSYQAALALFEAFKDYRFDATFHYAQLLLNLSIQLHDAQKIAENRLRLGTTLITSGMFKETFDCLRETNPHLLNSSLKKSYYVLHSWAYSDLAKYNNDRFYAPADMDKKFLYLDSAIMLTRPGTFERLILEAQRKPGVGPHPARYYLTLINRNLLPHEEAMVATGLSRYRTGDEKIRLLSTAAIDDIRTSTYRAQAMLDLANALHAQGKIDEAYYFLQEAMDQANKFGGRLQRYQVARLLPVITAKRDMLAAQDKQRFLVYMAAIIVVAIITGLVCFIVFVQLKKVRAGEYIIRESNHLLAEKNQQLWEEGRIKEEYIGFFFSELSRYILKLDKLKKSVQRKMKSDNPKDTLQILDRIDINLERHELFLTFDRIFLKLFPDFVDAINAMLPEEDKLKPKAQGTLTAQLRIFALMRLGINNNEMIAAILEYSVSTVYTYRFRLKSKALVPANDFEQRIMGIQLSAT